MMLPDELELLTLAVDGELPARDARRLRGLLDRSPPACALYQQMQDDRRRLRQLTPVPLPAAVATRLAAAVAALPPFDFAVTPSRHSPKRGAAWAPLAVAASLLFAVGATSFWFVVRNEKERPHAPGLVRQDPSRGAAAPDAKPQIPSGDSPWRNELPPEAGPPPSQPVREDATTAKLPAPPAALPAPSVPAREVAAPPRPVVPDFLTSPLLEPSAPFDTVQVRLPFLVSLADVKDKGDGLLRELHRDSAFRLDLFGSNPHHALDMLRNALRGGGVTVHTDAAAHDRHKKKTPTAYVLYLECLNAAEVRELLNRLAAADSRQPSRTFDTLHLAPAQAADQRELKELIGIDVGLWKRGEPASQAKGVSAGTADHVARAVASGTVGKGVERPAVVLIHAPPASRPKPASSKEVQHFLARRGDRKPGAIPLMVVVRGLN